jgi:hypothetical protein
MTKEYLGDGVYAEIENGMIKVTTSNGISDTNTIFLEAPVARKLMFYIQAILNEGE